MTDIATGNAPELLVELTADIVAAYVSNHVVPVSDLANLISDVHSALSNTSVPQPAAAIVEKQKPAVSVRKSVQDEQITCLECGGNFKSLKRHLMTHHSLSAGRIPREMGPADRLPDGSARLCRSAFAPGKGDGPRAAPQARPRLSFFESIDDKKPGLVPGFFVRLFKARKIISMEPVRNVRNGFPRQSAKRFCRESAKAKG
ncbi:putative transcriptional regulator [Rhizobium leguminosarum]